MTADSSYISALPPITRMHLIASVLQPVTLSMGHTYHPTRVSPVLPTKEVLSTHQDFGMRMEPDTSYTRLTRIRLAMADSVAMKLSPLFLHQSSYNKLKATG